LSDLHVNQLAEICLLIMMYVMTLQVSSSQRCSCWFTALLLTYMNQGQNKQRHWFQKMKSSGKSV